MKQIKGLRSKVLTVQGEPMKDGEEDAIIKSFILNCLFTFKPEAPAQAIRISTKLLPILQASKNALL